MFVSKRLRKVSVTPFSFAYLRGQFFMFHICTSLHLIQDVYEPASKYYVAQQREYGWCQADYSAWYFGSKYKGM